MRWMLKNSDGKEDAVLTMSLIGFLIVMVKVLLSGVSLTFVGNVYSFGEVGADVVASVLGTTLGAYVGRRFTDKKFEAGTQQVTKEESAGD